MDGKDLGDLFHLVHDSIFVRDLQGRMLAWNNASVRLYGWDEAAALGQPAHELLSTRHADPLSELEARLLADGRWAGEHTRRAADGRDLAIEARWSLQRDAHGQPTAIIETGRDITARREAEDALRRSERRYRNLFGAMAVSYWDLDFFGVGQMLWQLRADGVTDFAAYLAAHPEVSREMMRATRVIDVNEETCALYRATKAELAGDVERFWPEASTAVYSASVVAAVSRAPSFSAETRLRRLDGTEFDALFTACFPRESVGAGSLLIGVIDLTERNQAQAALHALQAEFAHAARVSMLGELTASIAHEVNQPLAAIATNASAGKRWLSRPQPDLDELRAINDRVIADAQRAAAIISRVRGMAERRAPEVGPLPINAVIEEAMGFLRHELQGRGVTVSLSLAPGLPPVSADRTQLQQVLVNLAVNAIQAMVGAGAAIRELGLRSEATDAGVRVSVSDSGPGIPPDDRPRLFQSFFTTKEGGMGMGLPICRSIIESHGGTLDAENNPEGPGARFTFTLPAAAAP
jgi:PAS domain S-box-containing protein